MLDRLIVGLAMASIIVAANETIGIGFGIGIVAVLLVVDHEERRARRAAIEMRHQLRVALWRAGQRNLARRSRR